MKPKTTSDPSQDTQRSTVYNLSDIVEYATSSVVARTILNRPTGSITILACDAGAAMDEKISEFESLVLVLDGNVEVRIDHRLHRVGTGQCIVMPAHFRNLIRSDARFKILLTVIKSGNEKSS